MSPTSATSHECPSLQPAEMGILAELRCPDVEMRIAILEMKAAAEQADIPRDVLEFLATRIESNIRVLEGALFKICAYFGGRDHSTILYGYNKVAELVAEDQEVLWLMNDVKTALRDP